MVKVFWVEAQNHSRQKTSVIGGNNMRQTGFSFLKQYKKEFGGALLSGKRKSRRPLSAKHPVHIVLKATGRRVFRPDDVKLKWLIRSECAKFRIQLYDSAPNWTHIHLLVRIPTRAAYVSWIRSLTSRIVRHLSKALAYDMSRIFDLRPYSKIVSWGRQFKGTLRYHIKNKIAASGAKVTQFSTFTNAQLNI
jgi:REP element-mobilizing transposase RayT